MSSLTAADDSKSPRSSDGSAKSSRSEKSKGNSTQADREKLALGFVKEHHPELISLLEQLKAMRSEEYQRAIGELFQVSQSLEAAQEEQSQAVRSRPRVLEGQVQGRTARGQADQCTLPELESQLRLALENQLDLEIRKQELLQEQLKARLNQVEKSVKRLKDNRDRQIDNRLLELQEKVRRARRQDGGKSAPAKPDRAKKESKA